MIKEIVVLVPIELEAADKQTSEEIVEELGERNDKMEILQLFARGLNKFFSVIHLDPLLELLTIPFLTQLNRYFRLLTDVKIWSGRPILRIF